MKKKPAHRLTFHRETMRMITPQAAAQAAGGATLGCPTGGSCATCLFNCLTHVTCTW
ncbi:MAG: hypothetical protein JOZ15_05485 [Acidobacteria bacterium]|nr:hypothetical protein [Acidobacteriota bacterium]